MVISSVVSQLTFPSVASIMVRVAPSPAIVAVNSSDWYTTVPNLSSSEQEARHSVTAAIASSETIPKIFFFILNSTFDLVKCIVSVHIIIKSHRIDAIAKITAGEQMLLKLDLYHLHRRCCVCSVHWFIMHKEKSSAKVQKFCATGVGFGRKNDDKAAFFWLRRVKLWLRRVKL